MSSDKTEAKCPFSQAAGAGTTNRDWWPKQLRIDLLHQHSSKSDPMDKDFDYAAAFRSLDLAAVKQDLAALMTHCGRAGSGRMRGCSAPAECPRSRGRR